MIKRDDRGEYVGVACDTCGQDAPPAAEILRGHGLERGFDWYCSGGTHICADCPHPEGERRFLNPSDQPLSERGRRNTSMLP